MFRPHRNSQKRYYDKNYIYFITINVQNKTPFFENDVFCDLLVEEIRLAKKLKRFLLYGFVIMPEHVHLLIHPGEEYNISKVMQFIKRHFSRAMNYINGHKNRFPEGDIGQCRLRGGGDRFQKINGSLVQDLIRQFDEYVEKIKIKIQANNETFPFFRWQKSFHDHIIRHQHDFDHHLNYILINPVKHHVCEDWRDYPWSSWQAHADLIDR